MSLLLLTLTETTTLQTLLGTSEPKTLIKHRLGGVLSKWELFVEIATRKGTQKKNATTLNKSIQNRVVNMIVANEDTPVEMSLPLDYSVTARMDQLQNQ
ncbi:hypothetical protein Tco_1167160 [Tanacetum coccineum]